MLAAFLTFSSCALPDDIRKFAVTSREALPAVTPVVRDITASCIRRQIAEESLTVVSDPENLPEACKSFASLEPEILHLTTALTFYFGALEKIASASKNNAGQPEGQLAAQIGAVSHLEAAQQKAVQSLISFIANAAIRAHNAREMSKAVQETDASVAVVADALDHIVTVEYARLLRAEQSAWRRRYQDAIAQDQSHNTALALVIQEQWRARLAELDKKHADQEHVRKILKDVRDGHHALATAAGSHTGRELGRGLEPFTDSLRSTITDLRNAF